MGDGRVRPAARLWDRRTVLRGLTTAAAAAAFGGVGGCSASFADLRLRLATGSTQGVYYSLGTGLVEAWQRNLGLRTTPEVIQTDGSVGNLSLLHSGRADVAFSQVDAAVDQLGKIARDDPKRPLALGRVYDEFVQVILPASSTARTLGQLRGARVSLGADQSGVFFVAQRLLEVAGLTPNDLQVRKLGIVDSADALARGEIDAFFWTGGIPTAGIDALARRTPIRVLDLADLIKEMRRRYPVYTPGTVPASSYGIPDAITTLLVRNALVVPADLPDDLAYALTQTVFTEQSELAATNGLALRIDLRAAIGIEPVELHPGALAYFRDVKDP